MPWALRHSASCSALASFGRTGLSSPLSSRTSSERAFFQTSGGEGRRCSSLSCFSSPPAMSSRQLVGQSPALSWPLPLSSEGGSAALLAGGVLSSPGGGVTSVLLPASTVGSAISVLMVDPDLAADALQRG